VWDRLLGRRAEARAPRPRLVSDVEMALEPDPAGPR